MRLPFAEDMNYWKTGKSTPDTWLDKAEAVIEKLGGTVNLRARGTNEQGRKAYLLDFTFGEDHFKVIWPVLPTLSGKPADQKAAERQAATMLYHDVKTRSLRCAIYGFRVAFLEFLLLGDGSSVGEWANADMAGDIPKLLTAGTRQ